MLKLVDEPEKKKRVQAFLERNLKSVLKRQGIRNIGFPGGNMDQMIYSAGEGKLWVSFGGPTDEPRTPRYWNAFGVYAPDRPAQTITVEINVATDNNNSRVAGFFAEDGETGNVFLMHSGRVGGGRSSIGKTAFLVRSKAKPVEVIETDGRIRSGIVIGKVESPDLAARIWRFVRSVQIFKDEAASGLLDTREFRQRVDEYDRYTKELSYMKRSLAGSSIAIPHFVLGQTYNRRRDVHGRFGGQRQGGISTPAKYPVVFIFTGASGAKHGYADEWTVDGTFRYFGEGQEGDMELTAGNRAVAEHAASGKDLLLFETLGKGQVRFRSAFNCASYAFERGKDRLGAMRRAIVFNLVPLDGGGVSATPDEAVVPRPKDLADLRRRAYASAGPARQSGKGETSRSYYVRSEAVRGYVLARAKGVCESCEQPAPFMTPTNNPYLEPHHIRRLTDGGPDDPRYVGAICPNCHRQIHHGRGGQKLNDRLLERVVAKESNAG